MPGPPPKRSSQRRRRNVGPAVDTSPAGAPAVWAEPDGDWHPIAVDWYLSLQASGQSAFYEASDVALARYVAEAMSRNLNAGARFSAQLFTAVMSATGDLLTSEGSRRRLRLELERAGDGGDADGDVVSELAEYRERIASQSS